MHHKLALSLVIVGVLVLTLAPKFLSDWSLVKSDASRLSSDVAALLQRSQVEVQIVRKPLYSLVFGVKGQCRLVATYASPDGGRLTAFRQDSQAEGMANFGIFYGDARREDLPRFWPPIADVLQRLVFRIGIDLPISPVIAIADNGECSGVSIDWSSIKLWQWTDKA